MIPTTVAAGVINEICINFTHGYDADLDIYLVAPNGVQIELSTDNGGSGDNYGSGSTYTCFTMSAAALITAGTAPFTASANYRPEGNLGIMNNGQNPPNS